MKYRTSLFQQFVLASLLAVGTGSIWAVLVSWSFERCATVLPSDDIYERLEVGIDGVPLIERYSLNPYEFKQVVDLDLKPVPVSYRPGLRGAQLTGKDEMLRLGSLSRRGPAAAFNDGGQPAAYWYFIFDGRPHGSGYFVGYDSLTKARIGFMGRNGFSVALPPHGQRFSEDNRTIRSRTMFASPTYGLREPGWGTSPTAYLASAGRLWEIDFQKKTVGVLLENERILSAGFFQPPTESPGPTHSPAPGRLCC